MKIAFGRAGAMLGGGAAALVVGVASVASACVPNVEVNTEFLVKKGSCAGSLAASASVGNTLWACGTGIENRDWTYQVKLYLGDHFDQSTNELRRRCGDLGVFQTEAKTTDVAWNSNTFTKDFKLQAALPGPAHFCALPLWNREGGIAANVATSSTKHCCSSEFYIYDNSGNFDII